MTSPASGATVRDTIWVSANAWDSGSGIAVVRFYVDSIDSNHLIKEEFSAPYEFSWDTTIVGNGSHRIAAVARDNAGNTTTSAPVTVNVANGDTTAPAVSVTSPASGAIVRGIITVSANAWDSGSGVASVQFYVDSIDSTHLIKEEFFAPYEFSWNTATVSDGSHRIVAVARDKVGNPTTSAPVAFTVANGTGGGGTPPPGGTTRFEIENMPQILGGSWAARGAEIAAFSGGTAGSSDVAGSTATFTFTGTAVSWIGLKCNVCGIANVSIDGAAATPVNTAGAGAVGSGLTSEPVFTRTGLVPGSHTMVIRVTGTTTSGGAHIVVDAFDVTQ